MSSGNCGSLLARLHACICRATWGDRIDRVGPRKERIQVPREGKVYSTLKSIVNSKAKDFRRFVASCRPIKKMKRES